jgi:hypothetical protein
VDILCLSAMCVCVLGVHEGGGGAAVPAPVVAPPGPPRHLPLLPGQPRPLPAGHPVLEVCRHRLRRQQ